MSARAWRVAGSLIVGLVLGLFGLGVAASTADPGVVDSVVTGSSSEQETVVYIFYVEGCPHCAKAKPFLESVARDHPGVRLEEIEVWHNDANRKHLETMAAAYGIDPSGVPVIFVGQHAWVGYRQGLTEVDILNRIEGCLAEACADPATVRLTDSGADDCGQTTTGEPVACDADAGLTADPNQSSVEVPLLGTVDLENKSLLVSTLLISFVDGVNPCSMWVLTVLIAMSLRYGSRKRTLLVGGTFILVTGLVYAAFIVGLFSALTIIGFRTWIQVAVALVALTMALISIKDYFWFKQGPSLTIGDDKKPGIYSKMRGVLTHSDSVPALIASTSVLAAGVSLVEFGCTAGFPVVWTNLLSAQQAGAGTFLLLLLLYMVIYQLDEMALFLTAVFTLKSIKVQEKEGRVLKLVGGMLMLALAVTMLVNPDLMSSVTGSLAVFGAAAAAVLVVLGADKLVRGRVAA